MSKVIVARLALAQGAGYEWVELEEPGVPRAGVASGDAAALARAAEGAPVRFLLPGEHVRLTAVKVPGRSDRLAAQTIPYAVEDELAEDIEALAFAFAAAGTDGLRAVAIMSKELLESYLSPLAAAGILLQAAVPECLTLPYGDRQWTVGLDGERVVVRTGRYAGFACERATLGFMLGKLQRLEAPTGISIVGDTDAEVESLLTTSGVVTPTIRPGPTPYLRHAAAACSGPLDATTLDLLPSQYRQREHGGVGRHAYRLAAALAFTALLTHLGFSYAEVLHLRHELAAIKHTQTEWFQRAFPQVKNLVNVRIQAEQELQKVKSLSAPDYAFLRLLSTAGAALGQDTGHGLELSGLNYADGILQLRALAPDVASIEQYSRELGKVLVAEVVSTEAGEHGVIGSLRLRQTKF